MDRKHFDFSAPVQNSHLFSGLPGNQSSYSGLKTEAAPIPQEPGVSVQRKLHLVAAAARQIKEPENTRLTLGGYIADILLDARHNARIFHWIVQRVGSAAIVYWDRNTLSRTPRRSAKLLEKLAGDEQKKA
jgi:hypothetical protein